MLLTLGVKNMFGCIIGFQKPEWHLRTGVDREMFARLLVRIYNAVKPSITIVDGILAMEGQGPGKSGTPRYLGLLIGGRNAFAVDRLICSLLGIDPDRLLTNKVAKELGLCSNEIYANGDFNIVDNFRFPELGSLLYGPKPFQRIMRKHIIQKPVVDNFLCELCGECWQYCPAKAITDNRKKIDFDYDTCIRCYCCIEVCPHGALSAKETLPGRLLRRFSA
jgi:ferredoxin